MTSYVGSEMELTMSMFATQADYWKARAEIAERALADLGVTPKEAAAGVARSKANQKDAERYRWLRHRTGASSGGFHNIYFPELPANWRQGSIAQHLDAAIDAEMAQTHNAPHNRQADGGTPLDCPS